ncbi:MAG: type II toxin-antitoxin system RelE/ParE family toxin [bacterium]
MSYKLIIRPEAEIDIKEAFRWYELRKSGLGKDFILRVDVCLAAIQRNPYAYPVKHKEIRKALLHRFPYGVFYLVEANDVAVIAVFHAKRDPQIWQDRI